jgi:hypothetical protein
MKQIKAGQRVRIINRQLVHFGQRGTVIRADANGGFYVHLDYDDDRPDAGTFFHTEELGVIASTSAQSEQPRDDKPLIDRQPDH